MAREEKTLTELEFQPTLDVDRANDYLWTVDTSDTSMSAYGTSKKVKVEAFIGDKGDKGDKGDTGSAATVDAGTTTTGNAGTNASVVNSGTTSAAVFDFTIPKGDKGDAGTNGTDGADGDSAYVYIAYASDASGADFTTTFSATLDYIAIKTTTTEITTPQASDFTGLWKNYKGVQGIQGLQGETGADGVDGTDGANAYVYIAYASDSSGTGFTTTFDTNLDYVAIKATTTEIVTPQASDFTGLWKNYKGATGTQGLQGVPGVDGADGLDINWLGVYAGGTPYVVNDAVFYNGSSYICKLASTGNLPTDTTYWDLMAQQGAAGSGSGDVTGPSSATDNAIARFDLATGKLIQNSLVTVDDNGSVNIPAGQQYLVNGSPVEGYSDEQAQDAVGTILTDTTTVDFTYTDETPSITADVKDASVANAKLANMATKTYKGRTSATTGVPEDVAVATLKTDLGLVKGDVGLGNVDNTSDATKNSATVTLTNKTIDGDTNTISNLAHGAEVDNPTSGVHGVTGSVVGTTDTQTLSAKTLTSPVINTGVSGTAVLDEDNMASDSATKLATQQSIKAYVDAQGFTWKGAWATSIPYSLNDTVENNGSGYICTSAHTSDASTEPGVGASWTDKWDLFVEGLPEPNITTATTTNLTGYLYGDGSNIGIKTTTNLLDWFYPVGSIYETTSTDLDTTTKMGTHFGGTWEAYGSGRVLVAKSSDTEFDTIGETGGAKTHQLTVGELATHDHKITRAINSEGFSTAYGAPVSGWGLQVEGASTSGTYYRNTDTTGSNTAHNNLQPYIVVYRYRRTA